MVDNAKIVHYIRERKGWIKESPRSEIWFNYQNEMLGGMKMVKVEVIERFTLGEFGKLKNIVRKSVDKPGELFVGDVFECDANMAKYLTGGNALKRTVVKVIEVIPEEKPKVEPKVEVKLNTEIKLDSKQIAKELKEKTTKKKKTSKK